MKTLNPTSMPPLALYDDGRVEEPIDPQHRRIQR